MKLDKGNCAAISWTDGDVESLTPTNASWSPSRVSVHIGWISSIEEAVKNVDFSEEIFEPSGNGDVYENKYREFMKIPRALESV